MSLEQLKTVEELIDFLRRFPDEMPDFSEQLLEQLEHPDFVCPPELEQLSSEWMKRKELRDASKPKSFTEGLERIAMESVQGQCEELAERLRRDRELLIQKQRSDYERQSNAKRRWLLNNRLAQFPEWSTLEIAYLIPSDWGNKFLVDTYQQVKNGRLGDQLLALCPQATTPRLWKVHEQVLIDLGIPATVLGGCVQPAFLPRKDGLAYLREKGMPEQSLENSWHLLSIQEVTDSESSIDTVPPSNWMRHKDVVAAILLRVRGTGYTEANIKRIVSEWCDKGKVKSIGRREKRRIDPDAVDIIAGYLLSKDASNHDSAYD